VASPGLVVANVAGTLLAYRDACAGCGASLAGGALDDGVLACPACRRQYALPLAGRSLGPEDLQLQPVPLLEEAGAVRVAVGA
jgi:nitrite reductase/ring-hydroxylating ferredoxin subunit